MYTSENKLCVSSVKLIPIAPAAFGDLTDQVYRRCYFCEKDCLSHLANKVITEKLSGPDKFYCPSCLRRGFYTKNSRNILVLSFRSIVGYFYYANYVTMTAGKRMYLSDIEDYIDSHIQAGLLNPLFDYDPDAFLWFVDFSRVGNSKRKVKIDEVFKTIVSILACFNLTQILPGVSTSVLFGKYKTAIMNFYQTRRRPSKRRLLVPTLSGCLLNEDKCHDKARIFTEREMYGKKR